MYPAKTSSPPSPVKETVTCCLVNPLRCHRSGNPNLALNRQRKTKMTDRASVSVSIRAHIREGALERLGADIEAYVNARLEEAADELLELEVVRADD